MIYLGDCVQVMPIFLDDNSVDACVTDPPYALNFMSKKWDHSVPSIELWREVLRVLKPGAHLLAFGGTRTYHRLVVNIEDAGFEIRDQIQWLYGSGFPKSHNISKGIDKKLGVNNIIGYKKDRWTGKGNSLNFSTDRPQSKSKITTPASDLAKKWDGFGTALKPANEPICLARKPLSEKTIVDNVLKWGCGGLNIDGSRIGSSDVFGGGGKVSHPKDQIYESGHGEYKNTGFKTSTQGRFPANLLLDESAAAMLDQQSGISKSTGGVNGSSNSFKLSKNTRLNSSNAGGLGDKGGASRFFYCAKASKSERNAGLEGLPKIECSIGDERPSGQSMQRLDGRETRRMSNTHPCVKPLKLMAYLCKLITPPNGIILDPFMGSGSTGIAAKKENFDFIGIEKEKEYFEIAKSRIENA